MFDSGKKIEELKNEVSELKESLKIFSESFQKNNELFQKMAEEFKNFKNSEIIYIKSLNEKITEIDSLRNNFENSLQNFNSIRNRLEELFVSRIVNLVDAETAKVKEKINSFESLENEFKNLTGGIKDIKEEIDKFKIISSQVKTSDFSLQKYAKELQEMDSEKLRLMRENDNLKTIIAKLRRNLQ